MLIPTVGLVVLATGRIGHDRAQVRTAEATLEGLEFEGRVADVHPVAQLELIARQGLARIDELGVSRRMVVLISGVDLEQQVTDNAPLLDEALERLDRLIATSHLPQRSAFGARLDSLRQTLSRVRDQNDRGETTPEMLDTVFDELAALLADYREAATRELESHGVVDQRHMRLATLNRVLVSAGVRGEAAMRAVLYPSAESNAAMVAADIVHEADLRAHRETLARAGLEAFEALEPPTATIPDIPTDSDLPFDPEIIALSNDIAASNIAYSARLSEYGHELQSGLVAEAERVATDAERRAQVTAALLVLSLLATVGLMWFVLWSVLSPVRQLTRRARAISEGALDLPPLRPTGPDDIRSLITTTNEMMTTLNQVQSEIARLGAGDLAGQSPSHLPGAIGVSLRDSIDRLALLTAQLRRSEQFASAVVQEAADAIWTIDADGRIRSANAAAAALVGVTPGAQTGAFLSDYLSVTDGEARIFTPDGGTCHVLVVSSRIDVDDTQFTVVIAHDISERARFEAQLAYHAEHDALTGLPNRFSLLRHLDERLNDEQLAVLFLDLDGFKNVNDTKGHAVGDLVLREVAGSLRKAVDSTDFIGRLGGDEFVIVTARATTTASAIELGQALIREVERPSHVGEVTFSLSASVGVTLPAVGSSAVETIRQADNAVYQAKRRGRGRVEVYDTSTQQQVEYEAELELALRSAVPNGELSLCLQPIVELSTGEIVAAEALVRWHRNGHDWVRPDEFIPLAERSSLIFDVERWVLDEACALIAQWSETDPTSRLRIAVNISGRHLINGDLVADVDRALQRSGADPARLELELTESQLLEDLDRATEVLETLRDRGITIAVDDFGTGYSSLTYLRHLPIDAVKIDQAFVANAPDRGYDATVIEALLTISERLDLTVVAEGVETLGQLEFLRGLGCDRAQGYLIAVPMTPDDFELLIAPLTSRTF